MPFYVPATILVLDKRENQAPGPHGTHNLIDVTVATWAIGSYDIRG